MRSKLEIYSIQGGPKLKTVLVVTYLPERSIKSNLIHINLTLQRTTKNSLSLPIKLSNQLELVASLIQIEQRCINPSMRDEMPLETTNFSLFSAVSDYQNSGCEERVWGNRNSNKEIINDFQCGIA